MWPNEQALQVIAYGEQMPVHLITRSLGITATKHCQQPPVSLDSGPGRFRTAAVPIVDGLHLAEAGEGGLQHAILGGIGNSVVEGERELIELVRLVDDLFRLINKLLEPVPLLGWRAGGGEGGHGRLDRTLGVEQLLGANIKKVIGHSKPVGGACQPI